mmetsp:Transcript_7152/g.18186  ORF Transcript_7152/g.18186 Transcript_7152/m.18186 type:complete len:273 (+) Transcript_7152:52-870(+)
MLQVLTFNSTMNGIDSILLQGLGPNDIICARNSLVHRNPGNQRYTAVVQEFADAYHATNEKTEKMAIRRQVAQRVLEYGGRFVRYEESSNSFEEITDKSKVREKIAHALRAADPKKKQATKQLRAIKAASGAAQKPSREQYDLRQDNPPLDHQIPAPSSLTPVVSSVEWNQIFARQRTLLRRFASDNCSGCPKPELISSQSASLEEQKPSACHPPSQLQQQQKLPPSSPGIDNDCWDPIPVHDLEPLPIHSPCNSPSISIEDFDNLFSSDEE